METRKGWQQGRVDVHDGAGKGCDHNIREDSHVTGQYDKFNTIFPQDFYQGGIVLPAAVESDVFMNDAGNAVCSGPGQRIRLGIVADDAGDTGINNTGLNAVDD